MKAFFKRIGRGFIFILILPFWLVVFVLFTVYSVLAFLFTIISAIPAFFKGESILAPSELDIAATTKIAEQKHMDSLPDAQIVPQQAPPQITVNVIQGPAPTPPQNQNYIEQDGVIYRALSSDEVNDLKVKEEQK